MPSLLSKTLGINGLVSALTIALLMSGAVGAPFVHYTIFSGGEISANATKSIDSSLGNSTGSTNYTITCRVSTEGTTYYDAYNTTDSKDSLISTSRNCSYILNNIVGSFRNIYIMKGIYALNNETTFAGLSDFQIIGAKGTILQRPANTNYSMWTVVDTHYFPMIIFENCSNFNISGMTLDGNAGNTVDQDTYGDAGNVGFEIAGCSQGTISNFNIYNTWGDPLNIVNSQFITVSNGNMTNTGYYAYPYSYSIGGSRYITTNNVNITGYAKMVEQYIPTPQTYFNTYLTYTNVHYVQNWTNNPTQYGANAVMNASVVSYEGSHISFRDCQFLTDVDSAYGNGIIIGALADGWPYPIPISNDWLFSHCQIVSGQGTQCFNIQDANDINLEYCNLTGGNYNIYLTNVNNSSIENSHFFGSVGNNMRIVIQTFSCNDTIQNNIFDATTVNPSWGQIALATNGADNTTIAFNTFKGSSVPWKAGIGVTNTIAFGNIPESCNNIVSP